MTEMVLIKWLLFLLMIAGTERWVSRDYSVGEEIMKTILESCYGPNSFPNPVVIFGDFNELIEGVSIIRINDFVNVEDYKENGSLKFEASSIVLMEEHPKKLLSHLRLLRRKKLWDNSVPFFIIGRNTARCTNSRSILKTMWRMEILHSIYICPNSIQSSPEIYTLNPITNYAPLPWKRIDKLDDLNVFRQNFDKNVPCTQLTYDKTKILNGHDIVAVGWEAPGHGRVPGENYFEEYAEFMFVHIRALRTTILALNARGRIEVETGYDSMEKRYLEGSADIMTEIFTVDSFSDHPYLFPFHRTELVAVVKSREEVSTLEKICQLWSIPVLITAAFAVAVLFLILVIKRWSFGLALLDVVGFLIYGSIRIGNRYQSFRIYYATMLIFIVISNGVFQGKIAAFLTTREKGSAAGSINELVELGYQMYAPLSNLNYAKRGCPRCDFKGVLTVHECVDLVLNNTKSLCAMVKEDYEPEYILSPLLDRVKESFSPALSSFKCRKDWPLRARFNDMMMRIVESGLPNFWEMHRTRIPKAKRQSMEAGWASAQYRPVAFKKLDFAFELLVAGLSLATIVFFLELFWARYVNL